VPNVTYNVVAKVDGGLENTFTYTTDAAGHASSVSERITSTFSGDINRNAWQQLLAGKRVGGPDYEGGHSAPSFLGAPGEKIGLFAQHQFQNRGHGAPNAAGSAFYETEGRVIKEVKRLLDADLPIDLRWSLEKVPGPKPGMPSAIMVDYRFAGGRAESEEFDNLIQGVKYSAGFQPRGHDSRGSSSSGVSATSVHGPRG
jgi:hypothetical protein